MRILCLCIMFFPVFAMGDDIVPLSTAYNAGIPALKASLLNAPECPDSTINGLPVADMPPANDPYSMPQHAIRLDGALPDATKPCTIELTFIDKGAGIIHASIQLAGERPRSVGPARQGSYTQLNTGTTRSAWFEFAPLNSSTGVTLFIGGLLHLHEVKIWPALPDTKWQAIRDSVPTNVNPMITLNRPMQLTTTAGVASKGDRDTLHPSLEALHELAPLARVLGFTSIESYLTWNRIEVSEGVFDFSYYDAIVEKIQSYGLKWFPLLIVGSAYALPDWFINSDENVGFVCLEHGIENPVQSIWSPYHKRHVIRVLNAIGEHYDGKGILEAVRLGPSGNYGESQYPAGGNWGHKGEEMHIHIGWWAGDQYGREDFQRFLQQKYGDITTLNKAWQSNLPDFQAVVMALPETEYILQRRLDFTQWYTDSMTNWCDWWAQVAAKAMPKTKIYQSAGGWGFREAGTDYSAQTKSMVPLQGGIRLTNETDSYEQNFYATRLAVSAARLYGVDLGFEPASSHTARGMAGRIYSTMAANGDHFFTYHPNLMDHPMEVKKWLECAPIMDTRQDPLIEVAVYYPETMNQLDDALFRHLYAWGFNPRAAAIRRVIDIDYLDERLIRDGFLDQYKALVFVWSGNVPDDVLQIMDAWMQRGGVAIFPSFPRTPLENTNGNSSIFNAWSNGNTGKGALYRFPGDMEPPSLYGQFTRKILCSMDTLHPWTRQALEAQLPEQVFITIQQDGHALILNYRDDNAHIKIGNSQLDLPPYSINRTDLN